MFVRVIYHGQQSSYHAGPVVFGPSNRRDVMNRKDASKLPGDVFKLEELNDEELAALKAKEDLKQGRPGIPKEELPVPDASGKIILDLADGNDDETPEDDTNDQTGDAPDESGDADEDTQKPTKVKKAAKK